MGCKTWGQTDATPAWALLSRPAHVDSWRGSVRALGDGVVHPDASAVQLHAVGSLHRLDGNKTGSDQGEHSGRNHWKSSTDATDWKPYFWGVRAQGGGLWDKADT